MQMREQHSNAMVVGRLKPGVSLTSATGEMNAIAARLASDYPKSNGGNGVALIPLRRYLMGDAEQGQLLLMGAVGLVLLIVCANVATLSLARSSSRDREMAIRTALGANRPRLVRQLVVESLLLAFIGGGLGLLLATGLGSTLGSLVPFSMQQLNPAGATAVDFRVQAFAFLITLVTGLGFGLAPAWQLSRTNPNDALKDRSSITPSAPGRFRTADAVVVAQVGLATLLVITAGLVLRSLWSLSSTPLGYQPENVLSLHLASPGARVGGSMLRVAAFYIEAADRLARLPGVEAAAVTSNLPFGNDDSSSQFRLLDRPAPQPEEYPSSPYRIVSRDYFRAMGIPLQRGRFFSGEEPMPSIPADNPKLPEIIAALRKVPFDGIVTRSFAQRFWPGQEPIGKQFLVGPAGVEMGNVTIVGVVGDTSQDSLSQSRHEEYYLSLRQFPAPFEYSLILRAHGDPSALAAAAKSELRQLTSQEPVYDVLPLSSRIADSFSTQTFETRLLSWFAGIALLLASVGLYGVLAFNVGRRSREFGIRIALGASTKSVLKAVFFRGFALVVPGLAIGVFAAWVLGRYVQNQLHGISASDPRTYATGVLALLISALLACWIPARRAAAVNPMDALRDE
jgi:predicted permease